METARSAHPQCVRRTTTGQNVGGRGPTNVLWVVFICLRHPIKHAFVQTINSITNSFQLCLSSERKRETLRRGGPVDSLTSCLNRDASVLSRYACKLGSDPILIKSHAKLRPKDSLHVSIPSADAHCQRIEINLGALAGLSRVAIVVLSSRREERDGSGCVQTTGIKDRENQGNDD